MTTAPHEPIADFLAMSGEVGSTDTDFKAHDSLRVKECHVLQDRSIGVFGAISLVVNKIVGAGYVNLCT